ncbi:hypothetical protein [Chitiniphilus eburneus]
MTLAELRAAFRRDAGDQAEPYGWATKDVDGWLNEAVEAACIRARLLRFADELTVLAGEDAVEIDHCHFEITRALWCEEDGRQRELDQLDILERDANRHAVADGPRGFVHRDGVLDLDAPAREAATLKLEGYRLACPMRAETDRPEIDRLHHRHLVDWALACAYRIPDVELEDASRALAAEARFERHFGPSPGARLRRAQTANTPHRNQLW